MRQRKRLGDKNTIGARITALRLEKGWKQKELLAKLQSSGADINDSSLSKLEGQNRKVTGNELIALAKIFNISSEDLMEKDIAELIIIMRESSKR